MLFEKKEYKERLKKVKEKVQLAKPGCYVTTPITSAIKAFTEMNAKKRN